MKILLIITELGEGGAENALGQVASGLSRRGHQVRVACLFNSDGAVARRLNAAGIEVDSLGVTGTAKLPAGLKRLRAVIRDKASGRDDRPATNGRIAWPAGFGVWSRRVARR